MCSILDHIDNLFYKSSGIGPQPTFLIKKKILKFHAPMLIFGDKRHCIILCVCQLFDQSSIKVLLFYQAKCISQISTRVTILDWSNLY